MTRCTAHNSDINIPAFYVWHAPIGNILTLCEACTWDWIKRAAEDDDDSMRPLRLERLADQRKGPIGILAALQLPRITEAEYDALIAEKLAGGTIETITLCDCGTWECDCDG
jgi:hypothetical protein